MGLGGQGRDDTFLPRTFPTLHAGKTCTDESGNFCERLPFLEILRSATTTSFQLRHTAFGSHKLSYGASSTVGSITAQFSLGRRPDMSDAHDGLQAGAVQYAF